MSMTTPIARRDAVRRISDQLRDRTSYVVAAPPHITDTVIAAAPQVDVLLDNGTDTVMVTTSAIAAVLAALLPSLAAVVLLVPKSTPPAQLRRWLGSDLPADGSRDIVVLGSPDDTHIFWPRLLVDAIADVEPLTAAEIAANDIRHLS